MRRAQSGSSRSSTSLNTWYFDGCPSSRTGRGSRRRDGESTFDEVVQGLDAGDRSPRGPAVHVLRRSCFSCDNCFAVCPDNAVIKLGPPGEYVIDLDYCKGCGLCVSECPAGAIEMCPEEI